MKAGKVGGLITYNVDPVYNLADGAEIFLKELKKLKLSVAMSLQNDDTANATSIYITNDSLFRILGRCNDY